MNFILKEGVNILEIRKGDALPLKEPTVINISGQIDSVVRYLKKRPDLKLVKCRVEADRDTGKLSLFINEEDPYFGKVVGSVEFSPKLIDWRLTKAETSFDSPRDLAMFIKKRTHHFDSKGEAMKLVSELMNFRAKVDRTIEASDDLRGNKKALFEQAVESNLPETFSIHIPIFKGDAEERIELEVLIDAESFTCTLFSPNLSELIEKGFDEKVQNELAVIEEDFDELVIIEL